MASSMDENPSVGRSRSDSSIEIGWMPRTVLLVPLMALALEEDVMAPSLRWTERLVARKSLEDLMMEENLETWLKTVVVWGFT